MIDLGLFSASKVKLIRQTEIGECGIACMTMLANYHGLQISLGAIRRRISPSQRGLSINVLMLAADQLGLAARALKLPADQAKNLRLPSMLHWEMDHYVILEKVKGNKYFIHDPRGDTRWVSYDDFSKAFTGIALEVEPKSDFRKLKLLDDINLLSVLKNIRGFKRSIIQVFLLTLVLQCFVILSPYYMQIAIDQAIPGLDGDLLSVLALGFALFTVVFVISTLLRSFTLLFIGTMMGFNLTSDIGWKLFRLPIDWFERRHMGDILSRFQAVSPIQHLLTHGAVAAVVDGIMVIVTLAVMFWYSAALAVLALAAFFLYAGVRFVSFSFEKRVVQSSIIAAGAEQTTLIESIRGITTLRLFGKEASRHAVWQSRLGEVINERVSIARVGIWQSSANALIFGLENILTVWIAIGYVIDGNGFSLGMVFAYMAYKGQFASQGGALIDQAIAFQLLGLHKERLADIALSQEDRSFNESGNERQILKGSIELREISFRYSNSDPLVLDKINLMVGAGQHIAITGPSGGGKSTLLKVIVGILEPQSGLILVDGIPITEFGYKHYHDQIAVVMQEDNLFTGTFSENIALFENEINMDQVIECALLSAIHKDIQAMPMKYDTMIGDMGSTLSGGQKQRLLLARALYKKPKILFMDEGTAQLDVKLERIVNKAISQLGITRIIIAHRPETVANADHVYYLVDNLLTSNLNG